MILWELEKQTVIGPGSDKVTEVRWTSADTCLVNGKTNTVIDTTITGSSAKEVSNKIAAIIGNSKADLFAVFKRTIPFKVGGKIQSRLVYSEVTL